MSTAARLTPLVGAGRAGRPAPPPFDDLAAASRAYADVVLAYLRIDA